MKKEQAEHYRQLLVRQRADLMAHLMQLRQGDVDSQMALLDNILPLAYATAQPAPESDEEPTLEDHEIAALSLVDAALKRLDGGVYGECMDCGLDIEGARLRATPQALRCEPCEEVFRRSGARSTY